MTNRSAMTVLNSPPPLPVRVLPVDRPVPPPLLLPVSLKPAAEQGYHWLSVMIMFLFCCWIPIASATMYLTWRI